MSCNALEMHEEDLLRVNAVSASMCFLYMISKVEYRKKRKIQKKKLGSLRSLLYSDCL